MLGKQLFLQDIQHAFKCTSIKQISNGKKLWEGESGNKLQQPKSLAENINILYSLPGEIMIKNPQLLLRHGKLYSTGDMKTHENYLHPAS